MAAQEWSSPGSVTLDMTWNAGCSKMLTETVRSITSGCVTQADAVYMDCNNQVAKRAGFVFRNNCAEYWVEAPGLKGKTPPMVVDAKRTKVSWIRHCHGGQTPSEINHDWSHNPKWPQPQERGVNFTIPTAHHGSNAWVQIWISSFFLPNCREPLAVLKCRSRA